LEDKEALNMHRTAIAANGISQVGYEDGSEILEIEFTQWQVFQFFNVPPKMFPSAHGLSVQGVLLPK
jgi:hypothetical protein